jgi:hypothetical protein
MGESTVKKIDGLKKEMSSEKTKVTQSEIPDSISFSGNYKPAQSLGNGRWQYKGKTYKEESI